MKNCKNISFKKQRGLSVVEICAGIVIAGFILFGIMRGINAGYSDSKMSQAEKDINNIYAAALKKKGYSTTFAGITCDNLVTDKWLDNGWTSCTAVNPYNGNYTAVPNSDPTRLNVTAVISDAAACRRLAETFNKLFTASCASTTLTVTFITS